MTTNHSSNQSGIEPIEPMQQHDSIEHPKGFFDRLIAGSIHYRGWVMLMTLALIIVGIFSYQKLSIDAVPDITNTQVQINTKANGFTTQETEQRITYPIENAMAGILGLQSTRSMSRYGLSQVTVVFKEGTDVYFARQQISQRLQEVSEQLPKSVMPEMSPVSTGLGEIYQWALVADPKAVKADGAPYTATDLRELQDWVVRPQLRGVEGVAEINTIGGYVREYQIAPDMMALGARGLTLESITQALEQNNINRGAGYLVNNGQLTTVRVPNQLSTIDDIKNINLATSNGLPIKIGDVAEVKFTTALRTGVATYQGSEVVQGLAMMRMGANSQQTADAVATKMLEVQRSLPKGVTVTTLYNRSNLVDKAIYTVQKNLVEGAILVIAILFIFLGNIRAAIITALVIPLSMLFTFAGMNRFGISANLMSLGALDFGIIIDGAVVVVENSLRRIGHEQHRTGRLLTRNERFTQVFNATKEARRPLIFGQLIILVVYIPLFALTGVEGKLFHPMAATVVIALVGAMILSVTFIPAAVALFVTGKVEEKENRIMRVAQRIYQKVLTFSFKNIPTVLVGSVCILLLSFLLVPKLGTEFTPVLNEGDLALEVALSPSADVGESVKAQARVSKLLLTHFGQDIKHVFGRAGTPELASDPMPPNISDVLVVMNPQAKWKNPNESWDDLKSRMNELLEKEAGLKVEFSQPIEMRFNELISGVRSDVGIKVYGDDLILLEQTAQKIATRLNSIAGASSIKVEQVSGLPSLSVNIRKTDAGRYGISGEVIQDAVVTAVGGISSGQVLEGDRRFNIVVKQDGATNKIDLLNQLPVPLPNGGTIPLNQVADVVNTLAPNQISRENGKRRIIVTTNVEGRDLGSFVSDIQTAMKNDIQLPAGYWIGYGGQFENLQSAQKRLQIVVPIALGLVFLLLFAMFGNIKDSLIVFTGIPFALTGGIVALYLRDIPLSVSAGVGFIALSGVAVLNGLVMLSFIRELREKGLSVHDAVFKGAMLRLRPVLMTALVASLGFIPMALATGTGAEVQRPLATVVIGGILSSTVLTLILLPMLYQLLDTVTLRKSKAVAEDS